MKKLSLIVLFLLLWGFFKLYDDPRGDWAVKEVNRIDIAGEISIYIFAAVLLVLFLMKRVVQRRPLVPTPLLKGSMFYVAGFYILGLISSVYSFLPIYSLFRAGQYLIFILIVLFLLDDYGKFFAPDTALKILYTFVIVNFVWIILASIISPDLIGFRESGVSGLGRYRVIGGMPFRWDFGLVPLIVTILSLSKILTESAWKRKGFYFFVMVVALYFVFLSGTRSIQMGAIVSIIYLITVAKKLNLWTAYSVILISGALLSVDQKWNILDYALRVESLGNLSGRWTTWEYSISNLSQVPLLGYGFLCTPFVFATPQFLGQVVTLDTHNSLIESFYNLGYPGLILTIIAIFIILREVFILSKAAKSKSEQSIYGQMGAITIAIIFTFFSSNGFAASINLSIEALIIISATFQMLKVSQETKMKPFVKSSAHSLDQIRHF